MRASGHLRALARQHPRRAAARRRRVVAVCAGDRDGGGALGNLIDRVFRAPGVFHGHVVDFFSLFDPHGRVFAIFNVADMALTFGVILAVLLELMGRQRDWTRLK